MAFMAISNTIFTDHLIAQNFASFAMISLLLKHLDAIFLNCTASICFRIYQSDVTCIFKVTSHVSERFNHVL